MYSLIKNGKIIDGSGESLIVKDLAIGSGKIQIIDSNINLDKKAEIIDAKGMIVSPGFIDLHSHIDHGILPFPNAESYIMQGITTSVGGNCGLSMAPLNEIYKNLTKQYLSPFLKKDFDYKWDWKSFSEFLQKVNSQPIALNIVLLVGHGTIRIAVKGFSKERLSITEMKKMKKLLNKSLEEGAFGLTAGLVYPPGCYANTKELINLTKDLAQYRAVFALHLRNESNKLIESVKEAIRIGEVNDISIEISHLKVVGKKNWGKITETLDVIQKAQERGVNVNFDVYPYTAAMTTISSLLPPWSLEGGIKKMLERLKNNKFREKIKEDIVEDRMEGENFINKIGWSNIIISECPLRPVYEGKSLQEILTEPTDSNKIFSYFFDWLLDIQCEATMVLYAMKEKDVELAITHPLSIVITDSWVSKPMNTGRPHPRGYGSFPRVLGKYVREKKLLTLEEAIKKMTFLPAKKIGIKDRGLIKKGYWADLVIFDLNAIKDKATFMNPYQYPRGIEYVIVNGQLVVKKGKITGVKPGKVLKR
jgi:N-acyl-D-aspartate/D-glutamate deacylase